MRRKRWLGLSATLLSLFLGLAGFFFSGNSIVASDSVYKQGLAEEGEAIVEVNENVELTEDFVVVGKKTLTGTGTLELNGSITVTSGSTLTVDDVVTVNTNETKPGIIVEEGASIVLDGTVLSNCTYGIQNKGTVEVHDVTITDCADHSVYNVGTLTGTTLTITSSADLCVANGGPFEVDGLTISGTFSKAIYNNNAGVLKVTNATIDGASGTHDYLVDNHGGKMEISNATIENAKTVAVMSRTSADTVLNGVTMNNVGSNGVFVETGCTATATDLEVKNVNGNAIYNKGFVEVQNLSADNVKSGISCRVKGWATVSGTNVFTNVKGIGIRIYGKENLTDNNGVTLAENAVLNMNTVKNTGICCAGTFFAEAGSSVSIEKVTGTSETDAAVGSGIAVLGGGKLDGDGTITVNDVTVNGISILDAKTSMKAKSIIVKKASANGIFVGDTEGSLLVAGKIDIDTVGGNGIDNTAGGDIAAHNISVANVSQYNGIANDNGGTFDVRHHVVVDKVGGTSADLYQGNGLFNNSGTIEVGGNLTITNVTASGYANNNSNNGVCGKGSNFIGGDLKIDGVAAGHGVFLTKTGVVHIFGDATINNVATQGKNGIYVADASGKNVCNFTVGNVTLTNIGGNGVQLTNHKGNSFIASGLVKVSGLAKGRGISNQGGVVTVKNIDVSDIRANYQGVENRGTMSVRGTYVKVTGMTNAGHGLYNTGNFKTPTNCTITITDVDGSKSNAVYNTATGTMKIGKVVIDGVTVTSAADASLGNGVYNLGVIDAKSFAISNVAGSGVQNLGDFKASQSVTVTTAGTDGLSNTGTFYSKSATVKDASAIHVNNSGDMEIATLGTSGTGTTGVYNSGYAELYKTTIDGASVTGSILVDNYGGVLDLTDATIKNAYATALNVSEQAYASLTNVVIDKAGNFGVWIGRGCEIAGNGLEINNVTKTASGAEGVPFKNLGDAFMLDHVTIGKDDPSVTGSGVAVSTTYGTAPGNAVIMDAATSTYSGYDLEISNATAGCAVYNKGFMYITDFATDNVKDGMVCRYDGWALLSGNSTLTNSSRNPILTYGVESNNYVNGVQLNEGANVVVDGGTSHGINNRGYFVAAADSNLTIKNIKGTNVNAITNNAGTMELGNVTIDNVLVNITMYNTTNINTNSGNGLMVSGPLTVHGEVNISNVYHAPANSKTDNTNGAGVVVKGNGSISGSGSITVNGTSNKTIDGVAYTGTYNGMLINKCNVNMTGDIKVDTAKNQAIYIADANTTLKAANVSVSNVASGHGVYINNASGSMDITGTFTASNITSGRGLYNVGTAKIGTNANISNTGNNAIESSGAVTVGGDIVIDTTASGKRGIYLNGASASVNAGNISISNTGEIGIYMNNAAGKITTGNLTITAPKSKGLVSYGVVNAKNITITDIPNSGGKYPGIENIGTITVTGNVNVERLANAAAIYNKGTLTVNGTTTLKDISGLIANAIQQNSGATMTFNDLVIDNITTTETTGNYGNGVYNMGTMTVNGTATITNVANNAIYHGNASNTPVTTINVLNADTCSGTLSGNGYAIFAEAPVTSANLKVTNLFWKNCLLGAYNANVDAGCVTAAIQQ